MNKKLYCYICNKDVRPKIDSQTNNYVVRGQSFDICEEVFLCPICGSELINENLDNSLYKIYNEYLKLNSLSFEKFKEIRNFYNLTQDLFAMALGWSRRSVIRYENADALPQNQHLNIYRKIDNNKDEFVNILKSNKNSMDEKTYWKIFDAIKVELSLKTINTFLYILKNYKLPKTHLMKDFFAIDFESFKRLGSTVTNFKYAHADHGPVIDGKDACLNFLLKQGYVEIEIDEKDVSLFKGIKDPDMKVFTNEEILVIDEVMSKFKNKKASELSDWSHNFKGYKDTKNGEIIKFEYAKYFDLNDGW